VLFQNMMRIWRGTFAATLLVLLALVVLGYAVFVPDQRKGLWWAWTSVSVVVTLGLIDLLPVDRYQPTGVGTQD
jgi:hypothetical protein